MPHDPLAPYLIPLRHGPHAPAPSLSPGFAARCLARTRREQERAALFRFALLTSLVPLLALALFSSAGLVHSPSAAAAISSCLDPAIFAQDTLTALLDKIAELAGRARLPLHPHGLT